MSCCTDLTKVDGIISAYPLVEASLISILQDIQAEYNWLPKEALDKVAQKLDLPISKIYSVTTFYKSFSLKPRGKVICKVCMGTACHIRGAANLMDELEKKLGIKEGQTTKDGMYTLEGVNCVGACAMAPVVVVGDKYHGGVEAHNVGKLVEGGDSDENK